jgi:phage terminase small subunit
MATKQPKDGAGSSQILNDRQERFCSEYLIDLNATQAAIRTGYSARTSKVQGARLLTNVNVIARVQELQAVRAERVGVDTDYVLERLVDEVEADMADLFDDNNRLLPINEWPLIWRQGLISSLDVQEIYAGQGKDRQHVGYTKKIRFSDRAQRLVSIGKHVNVQAFKENVGVGATFSIEDFVLGKAKANGLLE